MNRALLACSLLSLGLASNALGQTRLEDYLPTDVSYDPAIPTPREVLGWDVGEWHVRHDQIVTYFEALAKASKRMQLQTIGTTHEQRRLLHATITKPTRLQNIDAVRRAHLEAVERGDLTQGRERPVVVWMGYSIHGNEPSGANAALLVAYYLCAAQGEAIDAVLEHCVVLLDPCLNPDGFARFAGWANMHKGKHPIGDPNHREHRESWPGGRTNHYWFDLNRDWLPLVHPESRARIEQFHAWRPNVLTDHHEMGTGSTFFFQPGVPTRKHPLTPARNVELTRELATYHARALDREGVLYFTEERFDDFYYGKGSTYPDIHGCVGVLFEQAGSRGHLARNDWGELSFPFTIANQVRVSLSTLAGAVAMRDDLLAYQAESTRSALVAAANDHVGAFVFDGSEDPARAQLLLELLQRHRIEVRRVSRMLKLDDHEYESASAYLVPIDQRQYRLVRALFERRTEFQDETFYDISAWTLPDAYGLPFAPVPRSTFEGLPVGDLVTDATMSAGNVQAHERVYAYAFDWSPYFAPRAVQRLLERGALLQVATRKFRAVTAAGERTFECGTIVVPARSGTLEPEALRASLEERARLDGLTVYALQGGLTPAGVDLGSPSMIVLHAARPLLVVGEGVSSYDAGELWHLLDEQFDVPVALVEASRLADVDWSTVTHLLLANGSTSPIGDEAKASIQRWIDRGGVVVAMRSAASWAERELLSRKPDGVERGKGDVVSPRERRPYEDYERSRALGTIPGTIFSANVDRTHPLGYGYARAFLPLMRRGTDVMELDRDPFANVVQYAPEPLLAGYASSANVARIARTAAVIATRVGRGSVIRMADDPAFRGFFLGTHKLFFNALFFGTAFGRTGPLAETVR
ncbi:MAG: hypothetical protein H6833_07580 [Planctomycetes bacterium]|nr:hypothetical protein [Planctomycetota bacterium]